MKPKPTIDPARSAIMRAIKGRDTGPELTVRSLLHSLGYRFRLHRRGLPGSPDIVLPSRRIAIFVHGCFWHQHGCARSLRQPKANADYWAAKLRRNAERDAANLRDLSALGWRTVILWECRLKDKATLTDLLLAELGPPGPLNPSSAQR
jgi:DNA mismatch endonuclease (patch repair protein)